MNPFDFIEYEEPDLQKFKRMQELRKAFEAARTGNYKPVPGTEDHSATQMQWFPKFREFEDYEKYLSDRASEVGIQPGLSQSSEPKSEKFIVSYFWKQGLESGHGCCQYILPINDLYELINDLQQTLLHRGEPMGSIVITNIYKL